jgi:hypothetical protein
MPLRISGRLAAVKAGDEIRVAQGVYKRTKHRGRSGDLSNVHIISGVVLQAATPSRAKPRTSEDRTLKRLSGDLKDDDAEVQHAYELALGLDVPKTASASSRSSRKALFFWKVAP